MWRRWGKITEGKDGTPPPRPRNEMWSRTFEGEAELEGL